MHKVYVGIGSNLGNPLLQINHAQKALQRLNSDDKLQCSPIYKSTPMENRQQPDYLNAVVCIKTNYCALELLDVLQSIENKQGRVRKTERWGARTLDLDILLFDNEIINHPRLIVPHYGLTERNFVIYPLADIAADLILPNGVKLKELYKACSSKGIQKIE